jgi:cytochrome c peroxidase
MINLLGEAEIYDKNLSPAKNIACATCHIPYEGFTGASSIFNATTAAQPGGTAITNATGPEPNYRLGPRNPQSYAYAPFSGILHYNATQGSFYGGNFWDMRATGLRLTNPAAEQAEGPPTNPVEMANPDTACVVWKASQSGYASLVTAIWGPQSFAIHWPGNVATVCAKPGPPPATDPFPVHLTSIERGISNSTYDHLAMSMATYESSAAVSPFSSKFDAYLAGNANLSASELRGYELFNGKASCNQATSAAPRLARSIPRLPRMWALSSAISRPTTLAFPRISPCRTTARASRINLDLLPIPWASNTLIWE